MDKLIIELRGLVGLVSDRSANPDSIQVLFPNATQPSADWIPETLHFSQPHHPRLFVRRGSVHGTSEVHTTPLNRCQDEEVETLDGVGLNGFHVTIEDGLSQPSLVVDRGTIGNPNQVGTNTTSCFYTADMEELSQQQMADPPLGPVSPELLLDEYSDASEPRLIARMVLTAGGLRVGGFWPDSGHYELTEFIPHPQPGTFVSYAKYLAEHLLLIADLTDGTAVFGLRDLADSTSTPNSLVLQADSGLLHLIVENSAAAACDAYDPHFLGHYLLRDGWRDLTKVRIPKTGAGVGLSGDNAQCSPTEHRG